MDSLIDNPFGPAGTRALLITLVTIVALATILSVWFARRAGDARTRSRPRPKVRIAQKIDHRRFSDLPCDTFCVQIPGPGSQVRSLLELAGYAFPKEAVADWISIHACLLPRDGTYQIELEPKTETSEANVIQFVRSAHDDSHEIIMTDSLAVGDRTFCIVVKESDLGSTAYAAAPRSTKRPTLAHKA